MTIQFEWDEEKNKSNRNKHGIWFEEARSVFNDPESRVFFDNDHSIKEDRFIIIGLSYSARLLIVVHCSKYSSSIVRIISARKVTRKEERFYEKRI